MKEVIKNLKEYVHDEFYAIEYIKKGIIYLHGKMPDNVKEYLEYKYSQIPELQFIIANKVILEGINLPISSLFVLNGINLYGKDLTNLIGRVNRLNLVFSQPPKLGLLMPQVHFVNSEEYNRRRGNFENKIRLLRSSVFADNVKNPTLENFDIENKENKDNVDKCKEIVENESIFFAVAEDPIQELKRQMISLGMNTIYTISDKLCQTILEKINRIKDRPELHESHFLERLRYLFIRHCDSNIIDNEFARLKNDKAIAYYKMFFKNRKQSLKENIAREVAYFQRRIAEGDCLMYIGESYGERAYVTTGREAYHNVYIDLSGKSSRQLANIAIVKQKIEEDFVSFKLRMFFQLIGGVLHYTGMGKVGDQDIHWAQNATLAECGFNGVDVHLFEVMDVGEYIYCGRIELVSEPYIEIQPGEDGNNRKVWMFPIRPVPDNDVRKPSMFVFADMEDYKTRGKNVDSEYAKILAEKKRRSGNIPASVGSVIQQPEPKLSIAVPKDLIGKKVKHKSFGIGVITGINGTTIDVNFEIAGTKKMGYEFCMKNSMLEFI